MSMPPRRVDSKGVSSAGKQSLLSRFFSPNKAAKPAEDVKATEADGARGSTKRRALVIPADDGEPAGDGSDCDASDSVVVVGETAGDGSGVAQPEAKRAKLDVAARPPAAVAEPVVASAEVEMAEVEEEPAASVSSVDGKDERDEDAGAIAEATPHEASQRSPGGATPKTVGGSWRSSPAAVKRHEKFKKFCLTTTSHRVKSEGDGEGAAGPRGKGKGKGKGGKVRYTPMEQQIVDLKARYPGMMLVVEVGYKYRFFGDDARTASKLLNIACFQDKNFLAASIPVPRLMIHMQRLVKAGLKVAVVQQIETAALKAVGDNRSAPFTRDVTAVYTASTLIGEQELGEQAGTVAKTVVRPSGGKGFFRRGTTKAKDVDEAEFDVEDGDADAPGASPSGSTFMMCLREDVGVADNGAATGSGTAGEPMELAAEAHGQREQVTIHFVALETSSGTIVYDSFRDDFLRSALETRLLQLTPAEVIVASDLSLETNKVVQQYCGRAGELGNVNGDGETVRHERVSPPASADAASAVVLDFFQSHYQARKEADEMGKHIDFVLGLGPGVTMALGSMVEYLRTFKIESILGNTSNFRHFDDVMHMRLPSTTMVNLEILRNSTTGGLDGSLYAMVRHTATAFGGRQLKQWLCQPLVDAERIRARQTAVDELRTTQAECVARLRKQLHRTPDVERGISRVYYRRCSPTDFMLLLNVFQNLMDAFGAPDEWRRGVTSPLLVSLASDLRDLRPCIAEFNARFDHEAAKDGVRQKLFPRDSNMQALWAQVQESRETLDQHLAQVRASLELSKLEFKTVSGIEYLIEVKRGTKVPDSWTVMSETKAMSRYHSPTITDQVAALARLDEQLVQRSSVLWQELLVDFSRHYVDFRSVLRSAAEFDCLFALVRVAGLPGYCRPDIVDYDEATGSVLDIVDGRHPMVEHAMAGSYVPNTVHMGDGEGARRGMVLTGPNMGGKSSLVRQVALTLVLAQIGSFVPATSARLTPVDGIYVRMGASDNIHRGHSTFFVEMFETADVLRECTPRSLIILDELGRGTSTYDGTAIAWATLSHVISEKRCLCLFVTHYPVIAKLTAEFPDALGSYHMAYMEEDGGEGKDKKIVFLYSLADGVAENSYGLNVARMAGLPSSVVANAATMAERMEAEERARRLHRTRLEILRTAASSSEDRAAVARSLARTIKGLER